MKCKYCGSEEIHIQPSGVHTGAICTKCGRWLKWLRPKEILEIESKNKDSVYQNAKKVQEFCKKQQKCEKCQFYEKVCRLCLSPINWDI